MNNLASSAARITINVQAVPAVRQTVHQTLKRETGPFVVS
jgi:hypothetical protein